MPTTPKNPYIKKFEEAYGAGNGSTAEFNTEANETLDLVDTALNGIEPLVDFDKLLEEKLKGMEPVDTKKLEDIKGFKVYLQGILAKKTTP